MTQMESVNPTQMNFSVTFLEKKTKDSFLKPFKKQGGKRDRNCTSLLLIWWTPNFPKRDFPRRDTRGLCKTHIWWDWYHPSHQPQSSSLIVGSPLVFKILKFLPFLFPPPPPQFIFLRMEEKTPLEIVNKPATHTHTQIKQKETRTISPSLHGFITRCKLKTKEERH